MAEVLVLVEHADGALKKISAELITAARVLGEPAAVVVGKPGTAEPLIKGLKASKARWKVIANQVIFGRKTVLRIAVVSITIHVLAVVSTALLGLHRLPGRQLPGR